MPMWTSRAIVTTWTSAMLEADLTAIWTVLQTEAMATESGIEASDAGVEVSVGTILLGVDNFGNRHVLIPLRPDEAFAEDLAGRSVQLRRIQYDSTTYLSAVCLERDLDGVFTQFARELLGEIAEADSPALSAVMALDRWRKLFSDRSDKSRLSRSQVIGLIGELLVLEEILTLDPLRRIDVWTGPSHSQHDFRRGSVAIEVKATLTREGRIVPISSVDQLDPPDSGSLYFVHHQLEADDTGSNLLNLIERIKALGVEIGAFYGLLELAGYRIEDSDEYWNARFRVIDRRVYNSNIDHFPKITPLSFKDEAVPPGTLNLSYAIDLTNEPPTPLSDAEVESLFRRVSE